MIDNLDIEAWLRTKSVKVLERGSELIFTHSTGTTSVLVRREARQVDLIEIDNSAIDGFYRKFVGASIGDSMLMFAATIKGGVKLSLGYRIRDFYQTRQLASELLNHIAEDDDIFMIGSLGSFFYAYDRKAPQKGLKCYDRDFQTVYENQALIQVLENWWQISLDNPKV